MGVDFFAPDFTEKLAAGLRFMISNEPPYLVHCNEGKDRAGMTIALLEALSGATMDEIIADYMESYENYYGVRDHHRLLPDDEWPPIPVLDGTHGRGAVHAQHDRIEHGRAGGS